MKIVINADDFGITKQCTDAILYCFKKEYITTTTIVANGEAFDYAINLVKTTPYRDRVGLHINLTEGRPLTNSIKTNPKFCDENGTFHGSFNRHAHLSSRDKNDVYKEIKAQFLLVKNSGLFIHHIDSHHHIHNSFRLLPIIIKIMKEEKIDKIRVARNIGNISLLKRIFKKFLNFSLRKFKYTDLMGSICDYRIFSKKSQSSKTLEIMIHPDFGNNGVLLDRENDNYDSPTGSTINDSFFG